jgi:hypothetical protein
MDGAGYARQIDVKARGMFLAVKERVAFDRREAAEELLEDVCEDRGLPECDGCTAGVLKRWIGCYRVESSWLAFPFLGILRDVRPPPPGKEQKSAELMEKKEAEFSGRQKSEVE